MKFTIVGSKIFCSRVDNTVDEGNVYRQVVEFDANVDKLPQHVAARLTTGEIESLEDFMADRKRIRENPADKNLPEALPGLLREATDILNSTDVVNATTYQKLSLAIAEINATFRRITPSAEKKPILVKGEMRNS